MRVYPPAGVVGRHGADESGDGVVGRGSSSASAVASVVLLRDKVAVPAEQRVGGNDGRDAVQSGSPHDFPSNRQSAALVVVESDAPFAELLSKDAIFFDQVVDHVLLPAPDPAGKREEEELQNEGVHGLDPTGSVALGAPDRVRCRRRPGPMSGD